VESPLPFVRERTLEDGPNWGLLIALSFCLEVWILAGVAFTAFT